MIKYQLNTTTGIIHVEFTNSVSFEELLDHVSLQEERKHFPKKLKILSNATNAKLSISTVQLKIIVEKMAETLEKYDKIYDAFVVEKPLETALSVMYMELAKLNKYEFKVFSGLDAAKHWLIHK